MGEKRPFEDDLLGEDERFDDYGNIIPIDWYDDGAGRIPPGDFGRSNAMREDETMLPGGRIVPIDDLEARGEMTDALWRKARPDVSAAHAEPDMEPDFDADDMPIRADKMSDAGRMRVRDPLGLRGRR